MEWNLFNYQEILDSKKVQPKKKKEYTQKECREYIEANFNPTYFNKVFFNILLDSYYSNDWLTSKVTPQEQLQWFKKLYNNFTYHLQTDEITLFSLKHDYDNAPAEYSLFIMLDDDYILECPRVKDLLYEENSLPACGIWWYNRDGTRATDYLTLTTEESVIWRNFVHCSGEIINPKETKENSYSEWWMDRREYYCFYKLKLHKFGKYGRVFDKHTYDCFCEYTFTFIDLFNYYHNKEVLV